MTGPINLASGVRVHVEFDAIYLEPIALDNGDGEGGVDVVGHRLVVEPSPSRYPISYAVPADASLTVTGVPVPPKVDDVVLPYTDLPVGSIIENVASDGLAQRLVNGWRCGDKNYPSLLQLFGPSSTPWRVVRIGEPS